MNKKFTSHNLNPKILDEADDVHFGTSFLETIIHEDIFNSLIAFLEDNSILALQLSSKVFRIRQQWKRQFKHCIYQRILGILQLNQIASIIDCKCSQFMYWDLMLDFKRLSLKYSHQYKYYSCQQSSEAQNIQKDIDRTFSHHPFFKQMHNRSKLHRILVALSKITQMGYVQGFNQIGGQLLLTGLNEQQTFWMMAYMMKKMKFQNIFLDSFKELQFLNFAVAVLLRNLVKEVSETMIENKIDISIITTRWFLVLFSYDLPEQLLLLLWNVFLQQGTKALMKMSLAIFQLVQDLEGIDNIYEFLKDDLLEALESQELQNTLIYHFHNFKITNSLIKDLREKYESQEESFTLSFDSETKKHYWRQGGGESARSLVSSFNEIVSEIQEERDSSYVRSQSFLNALFPRLINNKQRQQQCQTQQVANEGKKMMSIKIEKKPQLIKKFKSSPKSQFKMSIPKSANGDQESNIFADELQSYMSPIQEDNSVDNECQPHSFQNFVITSLVKLK